MKTDKTSHMHLKRNSIAEWAVTLLILLFGTATLAQPFVIPSGSMKTRY